MKTIKIIFLILLPFLVMGSITAIGVLIAESEHEGTFLLIGILFFWFMFLSIPNMDFDEIERKINKFLEL